MVVPLLEGLGRLGLLCAEMVRLACLLKGDEILCRFRYFFLFEFAADDVIERRKRAF